MPTPWKLFKIDFLNGELSADSSPYRKKREQQITRWRENNFSDGIKTDFVDKVGDAAIIRQLREIDKTSKQKDVKERPDNVAANKFKINKMSEKYKTAKVEIIDKRSFPQKKNHKLKSVSSSSRVQKAKENFTRNNKHFLNNAIEKYKKNERDIHLDIPNLKIAIEKSIESLSFPKEILDQLRDQNGSGSNGRLCNLEAGWLPKSDLYHIPDDYSHHILPYNIKIPKTIDERQKERMTNSNKTESLTEHKKFDPVIDLPYLFN
jgi:hypothetical protein